MSEQMIAAIEAALKKGKNVELTVDKHGSIKIREVLRRELKT